MNPYTSKMHSVHRSPPKGGVYGCTVYEVNDSERKVNDGCTAQNETLRPMIGTPPGKVLPAKLFDGTPYGETAQKY